jgi:phenylpropionate dioxygenase-like ring-hydroxylating dioxygenase large terminal subunit
VSTNWPPAIARAWHPVAHAHECGARPLARSLLGTPLVVFRGHAGPAVLIDRCPHRNMPLSTGRVERGRIVCPYHGWQFDSEGACVAVPGSDCVPEVGARPLPVRVAAGLVWTCLADAPPEFSSLPATLEDPDLDRFWWPLAASQARVLDAIENLLDPAHPHFLHSWLVRRPSARQRVDVRFTSDANGGEARYEEAEARLAWLPRLFEGRRTTVVGRYLAPCSAQLAFESTRGPTLTLTVVFSPEAPDRTRPFANFATSRGTLPAWAKRWLLMAFHRPVLRQDRVALATQATNIARFGAAAYQHGPLDLFGPLIWAMVNDQSPPLQERQFQFRL